MYKTHLIDKLPWWGGMLMACGYLLAFIICVGVGGNGPEPAARFTAIPNADSNLICGDPSNCKIYYGTALGGLSGYNQALWMVARMQRPSDAITGVPMLLTQTVEYTQEFVLYAYATADDGNKIMIANNVSHVATMVCKAQELLCGSAFVFGQAFIKYPAYHVSLYFNKPYAAFVEAGIAPSRFDPNAAVGMQISVGHVNKDFTHFQLASKYTFFALHIVMIAVYIYVCWAGKGASNPRTGDKLQFSGDQVWVLVLSFFLFFYNEPFFAINIFNPNFAASGFYAFSAVTFMAILLLYWLVMFDSARSGSGSGVGSASGGVTASIARTLRCSAVAAGLLFWVPKLLWVVVSWLLVLSYYMVVRGAYLSDPAFNLVEAFPLVGRYFRSFVGVWGGLYVLYLLVLFLLGCGQCKTMKPSGRYVIAITILSLIAILVGYFLNGLLTVNSSNSSVLFMTAYGAANCYVWFLMVAYMPALPATPEELDKAEAPQSPTNAPYGGVAEPERARLVDGVDVAVQTDFTGFASSSLDIAAADDIQVKFGEAVEHVTATEAEGDASGAEWH